MQPAQVDAPAVSRFGDEAGDFMFTMAFPHLRGRVAEQGHRTTLHPRWAERAHSLQSDLPSGATNGFRHIPSPLNDGHPLLMQGISSPRRPAMPYGASDTHIDRFARTQGLSMPMDQHERQPWQHRIRIPFVRHA